jgi:hypothetical protein
MPKIPTIKVKDNFNAFLTVFFLKASRMAQVVERLPSKH